MNVIDAQIHIWRAPSPARPWPDEGARFRHGPEEVTPEAVIADMDATGVAGALLVPPSFEGDRNDAVADAVSRYPDRFRAIGRLALDTEQAAFEVRQLASDWRFAGLRVTLNGRAEGWLRDGVLDWLWPLAEELDLAITMFPPGQLGRVGKIVAAHPRLRLSIDHLALGLDVHDEAIIPVVEELCSLATIPNVAVKASSLPCYVSEPYPFALLGRVLGDVVGAFGTDRVFWGSDLTRLTCSYAESQSYVGEVIQGVSEVELAQILGGSLVNWFRLGDWAGVNADQVGR